jgi:hypothetical protein
MNVEHTSEMTGEVYVRPPTNAYAPPSARYLFPKFTLGTCFASGGTS